MNFRTGLGASLLGALLLTGCASNTPPPTVVTVTATPRVVIFNPATSGKVLAARITTKIKPKTSSDKVTGVECKNFSDLKVGTHTDCQMRVNGVKEGFRATFTGREGHYVLKSQKLVW